MKGRKLLSMAIFVQTVIINCPTRRPGAGGIAMKWRNISAGGTIITWDANNNQHAHFFPTFHKYIHGPVHTPDN